MSFHNQRAFYRGATSLTRADRHLTQEELREVAPSTYAEDQHASRSERYGYVSTREIIRALWQEGFAPYSVQQARVRTEDRRGFQKHAVTFRQRDDAPAPALRSVGDISKFEVTVVNSHDGTSSLQAYGGVFRLVCLNGMVAGEILESIRVSHTVNAIEGAVGAVTALASNSHRVFDAIGEMKARMLTREERLAFAETALALRYSADGAPISAEAVLRPLRAEDTGLDLWSTLNVLQEHLVRGGDRAWVRQDNGRARRMTSRAVTGIGQNIDLNRSMWNAAEALIAA